MRTSKIPKQSNSPITAEHTSLIKLKETKKTKNYPHANR